MSAPTILKTYPEDADTGIPVGETIKVWFDRGVDLASAKASIVLMGADFDTASGPDLAQWADPETGTNPYFLKSPGFAGPVDLVFEHAYADATTFVEVSSPVTITGEADEVSNNYGSLIKITPKSGQMAPDVEYKLFVNGDPSALDVGITSRTIFDLVADAGNASATGVPGLLPTTYTGITSDTVNIKITEAGDIGTAKFKYWYTALGEGSATTGKVTSRRPRRLEDGLQINFTGSGFVVDDLWTANVEPVERLAANYKVEFTTNDGSYVAAPTETSTPATSSPPASMLPSVGGGSASSISIKSVTPADGSYNITPEGRTIVIEFTADVDPATITDDSITLWNYPISGHYSDTREPVEMFKSIDVSGAIVTITF